MMSKTLRKPIIRDCREVGNVMSEIKIFHNPRCSKSRAAVSLLKNGIAAEAVKYLDTPPDLSGEGYFQQVGLESARGMMRVKDDLYKVGLDNPIWTMTRCCVPSPIIPPCWSVRCLANGKAAVGRPLENIEAVL